MPGNRGRAWNWRGDGAAVCGGGRGRGGGDLDKGPAEEVAAGITSEGGQALALALDVSNRQATESVAAQVPSASGGWIVW